MTMSVTVPTASTPMTSIAITFHPLARSTSYVTDWPKGFSVTLQGPLTRPSTSARMKT